jgi:hypothetical protein
MNRWLAAYFLLTLPMFFTNCAEKIPVWNKNVYHGNFQKGVVERTQSGEEIPTSDPRFSKMFCVFQADLDCLIETYIINGKAWKKQSACGLQPTNSNP